MPSVEEFLKEPSEELLEGFSCEKLICVAEHFHLDVGDKRMKENIFKKNTGCWSYWGQC